MNLPRNTKFIEKTNNTIDDKIAGEGKIKIHFNGAVVFPKIGGAIATNKRRILVKPTDIDNNCLGIIPDRLCGTNWLFLLLTSMDFTEYQSGTSVPALTQGTLGLIVTGVPPLTEQKRIVAKVDQLMTLCDQLEEKLNQSQQKSEKLMTATVQQLLIA